MPTTKAAQTEEAVGGFDEKGRLPGDDPILSSTMLTPPEFEPGGVTLPVWITPYDPTRDESLANQVGVQAGVRLEGTTYEPLEDNTDDSGDLEAAAELAEARDIPEDHALRAVQAARRMGYAIRG
jgi:hypothetical protein